MDTERCRFVFGVDVAPVDIDDDDELLDWVQRVIGPPSDAVDLDGLADDLDLPDDFDFEPPDQLGSLIAYVPVIRQILGDEPPEAWEAAKRCVAAGSDDRDALGELAIVMMHHLEEILGAGDADGAREAGAVEMLAERYRTLPLPSRDELEDTVAEVLADHPGIGIAAAADAVAARCERPAVESLLGRLAAMIIDHLIEFDEVAIVGDDAVVHLPTVSARSVLTHRINEAEIELGALMCVANDLALFSHHDDLWLTDGSELDVFSLDDDHLGWGQRESGWLAGFAVGDLLAVRVDTDGVVTVERIDESDLAGGSDADALADRLARACAAEAAELGTPQRLLEVMAAMVVEAPDTFAVPHLPITELAERAGLDRRTGRIALDAGAWDYYDRVRRSARLRAAASSAEIVDHAIDALDIIEFRYFADDPVAARRLFALLGDEAGEVAELVAVELYSADDGDDPAYALALGDDLVAAATRRPQEAAARTLAGLLAEAVPDVEVAEEHFRAGFAADPDSLLLVDRLAWYASDRGDAATAARLWSRLTGDPGELELVQRYASAATPSTRIGRNDPCWCGSGRKYKACHLGRPAIVPLEDRIDWICRKQTSWLSRCARGGHVENTLYDLATARAVDPDDARSVAASFSDPLVFDVALTELELARRFLFERGALLPDDERLLVEAWLLTERSVFEFVDVRRDEGFTVRDLRTGDELDVRERALTHHVQPGQMALLHVVPDGAGHVLIGGVVLVAPGRETEAIALCDDADAFGLMTFARSLEATPQLSTREGEPMVVVTIEAAVPDPVAAGQVLDELYEPDEDNVPGDGTWRAMHPLNADESIVRATLTLDEEGLLIETNADARADRVLAELRDRVEGLVVISDERQPLEAMVEAAESMAGSGVGSPGPSLSLDEREEIMAMFEEQWLSQPVPALGDITPREAAADPTRREQVRRLIDSFPDLDDGEMFGLRPDRLRAALGLDR
ncbi:MAG: YecA family protein [Acidimicrobiales bacterium]